jgi:LysR family glycine cleavage system transcriptional activator
MAWRLPPLNALRAAEAAGRHMSFTRAADELHVTPGAISRQVKLLEEYLGIPVFDRNNRELRMAPEAKAYLRVLSDTFQGLDGATRRFLDARRGRPLHIHCSMTFTLRWLVPRLTAFHASHPLREIRITTAVVPITSKLEEGDVDMMIELGDGDWPGLIYHRLADSELVPACSPKLLEQFSAARRPEELAGQTLLHSLARPDDWANWLAAAGAGSVDTYRGLRFESSSLAYQAAIEGMGVAIAQRCLVQEDLKAGRLVLPFDFSHKDGCGYFMIYLPALAQERRLVEFRDWILDPAAPFSAPPG